MSSDKIPTNLITGFLGVGKTTAINHLLADKPPEETWSVLVNEFGEIGVDGALIDQKNAHVLEVPGGCICCVAGLPMKVALNMLIATTRPDRLLIEPTGLGHPAEIINTLTGEYYERVLDLRATVTLIDPRKLADPRYAQNSTFNDQVAVADVLVANKVDLCTGADLSAFVQLAASLEPAPQREQVRFGALDPAWLDRPRAPRAGVRPKPRAHSLLGPREPVYEPEVVIPEGEDFLRRENRGEGYYSCGWVFRPEVAFDFDRLFALFSGFAVARLKAVVITERGVFGFNGEDGVLSVQELDDCMDSRIEWIDREPPPVADIERSLLAARTELSF